MAIEESTPKFDPMEPYVRMDIDGWIGLSNNQGQN